MGRTQLNRYALAALVEAQTDLPRFSSQRDLAREAEVAPATLRDAMSGRRGLSDQLVAQVAAALAVPVDALICTCGDGR